MSSNGKNGSAPPGVPWGTIREVSADEMPNRRSGSKWFDLVSELALRLEKTPPDKALALEFDAGSDTAYVRKCIAQTFFSRFGPGYARTSTRGNTVYVARGPKWRKFPDKPVPEFAEEDEA